MSTRTVLIAEDDDTFVTLIILALRGLNLTFSTAKDGHAALKLLSAQKFDMVLTDFRLPGIDGLQVLQEARKRYPESKLILMSASSDDMMENESAKSLLHAYVCKPIKPLVLREIVAKTIAANENS